MPPEPSTHAYAPQLVLEPGCEQNPVASHNVFVAVPPAQDAEQGVLCDACLQACEVPVQPPGVQIVLVPAGQTLRGSWPPGTSEQVPFDEDRAQYWHVPVQPVSQQTPSTQWAAPSVPFWQSLFAAQTEPSGFFPHELPVQTFPAEHWLPPLVQLP